ncbi:hypothetical protein QP028_15000 [Corynebacterium suedekumii]|nr:hypothetical protein QP028_15000 [Corynebacterium suedekumii]
MEVCPIRWTRAMACASIDRLDLWFDEDDHGGRLDVQARAAGGDLGEQD